MTEMVPNYQLSLKSGTAVSIHKRLSLVQQVYTENVCLALVTQKCRCHETFFKSLRMVL